MDEIELRDWTADRRRYVGDPRTGRFQSSDQLATTDAGVGCSGFASVEKIGLLRRHSCFVTIYMWRGHLLVAIDGGVCDWNSNRFKATRRRLAPLVKRFRLWEDGSRIFGCTYWAFEESFPGPEATDVFMHIMEATRTLDTMARFVCFWEARSEGKAPGQVSGLDEAVNRRLGKWRQESEGDVADGL